MKIEERIDMYLGEAITMDRQNTADLSRFVLQFGTDGKKFFLNGEGAASSSPDPAYDALAKKGLLKKSKEKDDKGTYWSYYLTKNGAAVAKQMIDQGTLAYYGKGSGRVAGMGRKRISWKSEYGEAKSPKI